MDRHQKLAEAPNAIRNLEELKRSAHYLRGLLLEGVTFFLDSDIGLTADGTRSAQASKRNLSTEDTGTRRSFGEHTKATAHRVGGAYHNAQTQTLFGNINQAARCEPENQTRRG
jgi:hypothetical protein